jgi:hypothetical protein
MAKIQFPPKKKSTSGKVAKGKITPKAANKLKHAPDAVLGKNDAAYHNC